MHLQSMCCQDSITQHGLAWLDKVLPRRPSGQPWRPFGCSLHPRHIQGPWSRGCANLIVHSTTSNHTLAHTGTHWHTHIQTQEAHRHKVPQTQTRHDQILSCTPVCVVVLYLCIVAQLKHFPITLIYPHTQHIDSTRNFQDKHSVSTHILTLPNATSIIHTTASASASSFVTKFK